MKSIKKRVKGAWTVLPIGLMMMCGTGYAQDTAYVIPPKVMIEIIKDVERGKACEVEVQMLLDRLVICENKEEAFEAILTLLQITLKDSETIYHEEKKRADVAEKAAKKYKRERNVVGGVGLVLIVLLLL
jgi:hypothetical protein